jgi:hypothetical protein
MIWQRLCHVQAVLWVQDAIRQAEAIPALVGLLQASLVRTSASEAASTIKAVPTADRHNIFGYATCALLCSQLFIRSGHAATPLIVLCPPHQQCMCQQRHCACADPLSIAALHLLYGV